MNSLRARLLAAWMLSLLAAAVVGSMLLGLYDQSSSAQSERAAEATAGACDAIADGWSFFATGWAGPLPTTDSTPDPDLQRELRNVLAFALAGRPALEAGLWQQGATAPLAATHPIDPDLITSLTALITAATDDGRAGTRLLAGGGAILIQTCAAPGPIPGLAAFAIARVPEAPGQQALILGVGGLFLLVLAMTALLGWATIAWTRRMAGLERALADAPPDRLPRLEATGERDVDRLVAALNAAGSRLAAAQGEAAGLAQRVAQSERFAALGRVAAGVAHEVRNPVAAMRLRAENALAGDDARRRLALEAILNQIARLERLTSELLTMTQKRHPTPAPVDLRDFLAAAAADNHTPTIPIDVTAAPLTVTLDATLLRRALDELLHNALRHAPPGTPIALAATTTPTTLILTIADRGPGVPEPLRASLFEPFVTGRPDGTGLGLAIAREMIETLGGHIDLADTAPGGSTNGATFRIEIPCPAS